MAEIAPPTTSPVLPGPGGTSPLKLLPGAGYCLLAYGLYNLVLVILSGGGGPEAVLARISQIVSLFPVLFLGPVLIFSAASPGRPLPGIWPSLVRWLVLLLAICYLLFVPLAFFNQYTIAKSDENVVKRLESTLLKRKGEILASVAGLADPTSIRNALARFPEISNVTIVPGESPATIRNGIADGINRGIRTQIDQLGTQLQARRSGFAAAVRTAAIGSLIAGISFLTLAANLLPGVRHAGQATGRTIAGIGGGLVAFRKKLGRETPPMQRGFNRWRLQLQRAQQRMKRRAEERKARRASEQRRRKLASSSGSRPSSR